MNDSSSRRPAKLSERPQQERSEQGPLRQQNPGWLRGWHHSRVLGLRLAFVLKGTRAVAVKGFRGFGLLARKGFWSPRAWVLHVSSLKGCPMLSVLSLWSCSFATKAVVFWESLLGLLGFRVGHFDVGHVWVRGPDRRFRRKGMQDLQKILRLEMCDLSAAVAADCW